MQSVASQGQTVTPSADAAAGAAAAASGGCGCNAGQNGNGGMTYPFVFALGAVEPRFPTLGVEKEFMQATGRAGTAGLSDRQAAHAVLTRPENRYLVRQLCWVFTIEGVETYILQPADPAGLDLLVESVRPVKRRTDVDVLVGQRGPIAPAAACAGLTVPMVAVSQVWSFDADALLKALPRPDKTDEKAFRPIAEELFNRIMQLADNAGATDEHRALNYLAVRYPGIYERASESFAQNFTLSAVDVVPSRLSGVRKLVNVVFVFTSRTSGVVEKYRVRVDVTEEFPFLETPVTPYLDVER